MNAFIQEEKGNPVVTLKAQAEKFGFSSLRAGKDNAGANSGATMYVDLPRMKLVIQNKVITKELVDELYNKHTNLISNDKNKYRQFVKQVFKELFEYAEAKVPSDSILEELITNCNQAGYEGALFTDVLFQAFRQSEFTLLSPQKTIVIDCTDPNHVKVKSEMAVPTVKSDNPEEVCQINSSLEFTLESQDGKEGVTYTNGNLSLTVPRKLRDYKIDDRNLFDIIKEYFYKFCEKLGFKLKIEHNLDKPLEVNSHLESVEPSAHSNEHGPGN